MNEPGGIEVSTANRVANDLNRIATKVRAQGHDLARVGWHVSGQQLANAANLLLDVERRLRNGDDWRG